METDDDIDGTVRRSKVRRHAYAQGLLVKRSTKRDPDDPTHATYQVVSNITGAVVATGLPGGYGMSLDDVEAYLASTG